jgi:4-diphosphocytidyl-2-C-methyl-D-erythritol kinase
VTVWEAPAKLNFSLELRPPDRTGYHPLRSLCQTIDLCDELVVAVGDDERLVVDGPDEVPAGEDNLVWKAVRCLVGRPDRPRLDLRLTKRIPAAAGLGGGSSDAAAALLAAATVYGSSDDEVVACAPDVGSDVPFMLVGGTRIMEGYGERLTEVEPLAGFAVAVAVPVFELSTRAVYRRWDDLGGPVGPVMPERALPPDLRPHGPLRNDLTLAAWSIEPEMADWSADLAGGWGRPVAMTGSGSAHFAYFHDLDEATEAVGRVSESRAAFAADLRGSGVAARSGEVPGSR